MKLTYRVVNNTPFIAEGTLDVDGEAVRFHRQARKIELTPDSPADTSGTILFVAAGQADMFQAQQWKVGSKVSVTIEKAE